MRRLSNVIPTIINNHNSSSIYVYAVMQDTRRCASGIPYHHIKPNLNQSDINSSSSSSSSPHNNNFNNYIPLQLDDIKSSILYIDSNYVGGLVITGYMHISIMYVYISLIFIYHIRLPSNKLLVIIIITSSSFSSSILYHELMNVSISLIFFLYIYIYIYI